MKVSRFLQLVAIAITCAVPASIFGGLVLNGDVDGYDAGPIQTFSGFGVTNVGGTFWNSLDSNGSIGVMKLSDGITTTPITFSITGSHGGAVNFGIPVPAAQGDLMRDYVYQPFASTTNILTFSNVPGGKDYDLYLYSMDGGQNATSTFTFVSSQIAKNSAVTTFVLGNNYVKFSGLVPVAGVIAGTWITDAALINAPGFNGFQLVELPEPSTMLLLGVGGVLLLLKRT